MFNDKIILITGGTGSWGQELTSELLNKYSPKEIRIFSRGEFAQVQMERKFNNNKLNFIIGDVSDYESLEFAMQGVDYVFHLAALKHVPVCERQPHEAIKTNVFGTINVVKLASKYKIKKVIDVSTDKAVDPLNVYGTTKALGEKIIINANNLSETSFVCIRSGNVIGTNGSIIPFWKDQIKNQKKITITDENMTRFFLTLKQAITLLLKAAEISERGETIVLKMPALFLKDLKQVMIKSIGNNDIKEEIIGLRAGEKLHEVLISKDESARSFVLDENYFLIAPYNKNPQSHKKYINLNKVNSEFSSNNTKILSQNEIVDLLKEEKWI